MLSRKTRYAIKALIYIGKHSGMESPVSVSAIARDTDIPYKFLEAILTDLRNTGVLGSKKGNNGGYYFGKPPEEVSLTQIIRATNGPIALLPCVSLNYYEPCDHCPDEKDCALHHVMIKVRDASLKILSDCTIRDLMNKEKKLLT